MEESVLKSMRFFGMPVDEENGMIIAIKELVGPVVALCLWGTSHVRRSDGSRHQRQPKRMLMGQLAREPPQRDSPISDLCSHPSRDP